MFTESEAVSVDIVVGGKVIATARLSLDIRVPEKEYVRLLMYNDAKLVGDEVDFIQTHRNLSLAIAKSTGGLVNRRINA